MEVLFKIFVAVVFYALFKAQVYWLGFEEGVLLAMALIIMSVIVK